MNGGKCFAVKDVWLDKDSPTETENLDKIFAALDEVDMNKYEWDPSINTTNDTCLQGIIGDALHKNTIDILWTLSATSEACLLRNLFRILFQIPRYLTQTRCHGHRPRWQNGLAQVLSNSHRGQNFQEDQEAHLCVLQSHVSLTIKPSSNIDLYMIMLASHLMRQQISSHFPRESMMLALVRLVAV